MISKLCMRLKYSFGKNLIDCCWTDLFSDLFKLISISCAKECLDFESNDPRGAQN